MCNVSKWEILSTKCFAKQNCLFRNVPLLCTFVVLARAKIWNNGEMILSGKTRSTGSKTCLSATLSTNNSDLERPVIEPGPPR